MSRHTAPYSFVMMRLMLVLLGAWTLSVQGLYIKQVSAPNQRWESTFTLPSEDYVLESDTCLRHTLPV